MRRSFTLFSIVAHTIVIAAACYAQILADSALLPAPHQPMLFDAGSFMAVDVQPPRPPVARARASDAVSDNAAPVEAPTGVRDETGREGDPSPKSDSLIPGVESGPPSSTIDGVGITEAVPPPPAAPVAPIRLHSGMKAPVKVVNVAPVYPAIARSAHIEGMVILEAVLDAQGRVDTVRVLRSIPLLDQAAIDAVQQWRFTPALLNGGPVPVVMTVTVNFQLRE